MKCPDKGIIQAYIDGELDIQLKKDMENHISACAKCNESLKALKENDDFVFGKLNSYRQYTRNNIAGFPEASASTGLYRRSFNEKKGVSIFMTRYKKVIAAACAVVVAATCITVQPVRSAIASTLSVFRVNNVKGITISLQDLQQIQSKLASSEPEIDMDKMGKIKVQGGHRKTYTPTDAKNIPGLNISLPTALSAQTPVIEVAEPTQVDFILNVDNVNQVLKSFGAKKLLPKDIDGKTFNINFSSQVNIRYNFDNKSYTLLETKSPEINVPDKVNVEDIYNSLVELPILPSNLQTQLKSIKDWKSTLYIPIVESKTEETEINGAKGYIMTGNSTVKGNSYSGIIWYNNGIIYALNGNSVKEDLINISKSVR